MSTPNDEPQGPAAGSEPPAREPARGHYGEIAPGVPRYGQYAPEGWQPPTAPGEGAGTNRTVPPASSYPGSIHPGYITPGPHLAPPKPVVTAFRLIFAAGILQALSTIVLVAVLFMPAGMSVLRDAVRTAAGSDPALTAAAGDSQLLMTALILGLIVSVIATVAYFWLAYAVRRGRNWARVVSAVLAVISLLALLQPNPLTIVQVLLGVIAVILVFRSPAKEYFQARRGPRP